MTQSVYTAHATISANGNSETVTLPGKFSKVSLFFGAGVTFGSGTVKAQVSPDGGTTWIDSPNGGSITSATANAKKADYDIFGPQMRWNLAGATGPTLNLATRAKEVADGVEIAPTALTANGSTAAFTLPRGHDTGTFAWTAWGTWGSGTLALQASPDGGTTWYLVDSATANAFKHITTNEDTLYRFTLSGATNPSLDMRVYCK